jgi:hypothetical protein
MVSPKKYTLCLLSVLAAIFFSCSEKKQKPLTPAKIQPVPVINNAEEKARLYNIDKSPMDMIYFPEDFPIMKMSGKFTGLPVARVIYSRPSKDGRQIFGNVVKYGTYWRLGANEGTELEFFSDVEIMGKKVKRGRYILYCIPYEKRWTLRLNDDLYTWGLRIHSAKDVYSFEVPVEKSPNVFEVLTMKFAKDDDGAKLIMAWDSVRAELPFKY